MINSAGARGQGAENVALATTSRDELPDKPMPVAPNVPATSSRSSADVGTYKDKDDEPDLLTLGDRARLYWQSIDNVGFLIAEPFGAAVDQAENSPSEWGQGWNAYAKRTGSDFAQGLTYRTIRFGIAALDGEDPRPYYTDQPELWSKVLHGIKTTLVSERVGGGEMPAVSRIAGIYGTAFVSNTWEPPARATNTEALKHGSISLAETTAYHIGGELWHAYRDRLPLPTFLRNK